MKRKDSYSWQSHVGEYHASKSGFDIISCETCRFMHAIPIPTEEELKKFYENHFYTDEKPLYFTQYEEDLEWWNFSYQERYDLFEKILSPNRRRILDVGSGPGYFLLQGKGRGWETLGVEPSLVATNYSRELGITVINSAFTDEMAKTLGTFDVINFGEVLEHVPHPEKTLKAAYSLLSPGGLLCVIVPNDYNPFQRALTKIDEFKPWWVAPPVHLNYFNFETLSNLFDRCGFCEVDRESTFPIDIFLLMGENYIANDAVGKSCHIKRKTLEKNLFKAGCNDLKRELYKAFAQLGIGREIQMIGKKKPCH